MMLENFEELRRDEQSVGDFDQMIRAQLDGRLLNLNTCMPGIIDSFDPVTQTASVQPAIKRQFIDGERALPKCVDVPVIFPNGGDFVMTFPVKKGDECLLVFGQRCIDSWFAAGGVQSPSEFRVHDLSDAFAIVGPFSRPRALPAFNMAGAEMRTRDRSVFLRVEAGGIVIKGNITQEGGIVSTGDHVAAGISLDGHHHGGVQTGGGNTGGPA